MAFVETKHTMAAIERIKKDLSIFITIVSYLSMIVFSFYYVYLIIKNVSNVLYLIIYIVLFITVLCSFFTQLLLKKKKYDSRKKLRIKLERRRQIGFITKLFKYIAKSITIGIAIYEMVKNPDFQLSLLINIVSIVMLGIQLIFEFIIYFINKYIDYLKYAFEMDFDSSFVTKIFKRKELKAKSLEAQVYELHGESIYTKQELKIIQTLKEDAERISKAKKEKVDISIKESKAEIKSFLGSKLSKKQQIKINDKYESSKKEAATLIAQPDKLDAILIKAEQMVSKLPGNIQALKYIPEFLSFINNYVNKRYTNVSKVSIIAAIGVIVYFVSPVDIIPDALPIIGYIDEAFVIGKCLDIIEDELERFIQWRDNNIE